VQEENTREKILQYINKYPGNHFRAIQRDLNLSLGVLQYHISVLKKQGEIVEFPINGFNCYFPKSMYNKQILTLFGHLRNKTRKKIIAALANKPSMTLNELRDVLKLSNSTLFYHLALLVKDSIVLREEVKNEIRYKLSNLDLIKSTLIDYKYSFLDKILRDLISLWEK